VHVVQAWRQWLLDHEITQPFKQAHREIYVLTDAERSTASYSNRFAAHVLRQHQLAALCRERGWRYALQGSGFDGANSPTKEIPGTDLIAEYWVEVPGEGPAGASGISLYVASDQVRFHERSGAAVPVESVPPLVFSETMRDVDLFVGVASIGNDPNWNDRGDRRFDGYWAEYAFGELSATAATRRAVLANLLPKLKIADRCQLADRFLIVRGDLRTYKIHLGSANIRMEPNDEYLCIVQDRSPKGVGELRARLPYEGDPTLALILSKAFLLADDVRVKDEGIAGQIRRGLPN
jgi:hypothetical protein